MKTQNCMENPNSTVNERQSKNVPFFLLLHISFCYNLKTKLSKIYDFPIHTCYLNERRNLPIKNYLVISWIKAFSSFYSLEVIADAKTFSNCHQRFDNFNKNSWKTL